MVSSPMMVVYHFNGRLPSMKWWNRFLLGTHLFSNVEQSQIIRSDRTRVELSNSLWIESAAQFLPCHRPQKRFRQFSFEKNPNYHSRMPVSLLPLSRFLLRWEEKLTRAPNSFFTLSGGSLALIWRAFGFSNWLFGSLFCSWSILSKYARHGGSMKWVQVRIRALLCPQHIRPARQGTQEGHGR